MILPASTLLYGLADSGQAAQAGRLGIGGAVIDVGNDGGLSPEEAHRVVSGLPPMSARFACLGEGDALPAGFWGAVTECGVPRPEGAMVHLVRVEQEHLNPSLIPNDADGLWIRPAYEGSGAATRFDYRAIEMLSFGHRIIIEVPDGAAGVEAAMRLGRPYALLFGEAVWHHPGIIDLDLLEGALAVVASLNKRSFLG